MSTHLYVVNYVLGEARSSFVIPGVTDLCCSLLHQRPAIPSPQSVGALLHLQYTGDRDYMAQRNSQHSDRTARPAVRIAVMFTIGLLVAGNRRDTLLNQSGHRLFTRHQKPNSYKGPTHNPKFIHLLHGKYNVYRNVYKSSLSVVERRSNALYISLKSLKELCLKSQGPTNFPSI